MMNDILEFLEKDEIKRKNNFKKLTDLLEEAGIIYKLVNDRLEFHFWLRDGVIIYNGRYYIYKIDETDDMIYSNIDELVKNFNKYKSDVMKVMKQG